MGVKLELEINDTMIVNEVFYLKEIPRTELGLRLQKELEKILKEAE